jgi:undecaprenyl-diphosphatase
MIESLPHRPAETLRRPARGWRIDPRHAMLAALVCWTGFVAMALLVASGRGAAFDAAGLRIWREGPGLAVPHGPHWLIEAVRDYTALGGALRHLFAVAAIMALLFLKLRREAVLFGITVIAGLLGEVLLKAVFARPRPTIVPHLMEAAGSSFPSGHSFNAAIVYIAMALAFAAISPCRSVRWTMIVGAMALTLLIALSRVWLGVHYPSDAIAGWLGGAGWAFLASALLYRPASTVAKDAGAASL